VPCPTTEQANVINIAKYEGYFVLYVRVRAKLIDRYGLSVPSVNLETKLIIFYHRLWNAGEQFTIEELSERNNKAREGKEKNNAIATTVADKRITIANGKAVAVSSKDGGQPKAKSSTKAAGTTKASKTVGANKKFNNKKQVADSPGSLKDFLKDDHESESVEDVTNSENDTDSCD
jgi:hypothetical protein